MLLRWRLILLFFVASAFLIIVSHGPRRVRYQAEWGANRVEKAQPTERQEQLLGAIRDLGGIAFDGRIATILDLDKPDSNGQSCVRIENTPDEVVFSVVIREWVDMDEILPYVIALDRVEYLSISGVALTDEHLRHIGELHSLRLLLVLDTDLTDAGFLHFRNLANLEALWLGDTSMTEQGLEHLEQMQSLKGLFLKGIQVTDGRLTYITALSDLISLSLRGSLVTDHGVKQLAQLSNLRALDLCDTQVTKVGVVYLQEALPKCKVSYGTAGDF
jgi:hypothetical protein